VAATTASTVTPGCRDRIRMAWSGVSKSKTPRLEITRRISWYCDAVGPAAAARSYPTPDTQSTVGTNARGEWLGTQ
jgi:hypothetical protein